MKNKQKKQLFITIAIILILIAVFCLIHFLNRTKNEFRLRQWKFCR